MENTLVDVKQQKAEEKYAKELTKEICSKYGIKLSKIVIGNSKRNYGSAVTKIGKITYSRTLFAEPHWKVTHTVCHEVAHLYADNKYGYFCKHDSNFQKSETEICLGFNIKPIYDRKRGYAVAFVDATTNEKLGCRIGYDFKDGRVQEDYVQKKNLKIVKKAFRDALNNYIFNNEVKYESACCEAIGGRVTLTTVKNNAREIIHQTNFKINNEFRIALKNVKCNARHISYTIDTDEK